VKNGDLWGTLLLLSHVYEVCTFQVCICTGNMETAHGAWRLAGEQSCELVGASMRSSFGWTSCCSVSSTHQPLTGYASPAHRRRGRLRFIAMPHTSNCRATRALAALAAMEPRMPEICVPCSHHLHSSIRTWKYAHGTTGLLHSRALRQARRGPDGFSLLVFRSCSY